MKAHFPRGRRRTFVSLVMVLAASLTMLAGQSASAAAHLPNVSIGYQSGHSFTYIGDQGCVQQPTSKHGTIVRVLRNGHVYLRLEPTGRARVVSGVADYELISGTDLTDYSRPWSGTSDLPVRTTVGFEGRSYHLKLSRAEVDLYDPTVHVPCQPEDMQIHPSAARVAGAAGRTAQSSARPPGRIESVVPTSGTAAIALRWTNPGGGEDLGTDLVRSGGPAGSSRSFGSGGQRDLPAGATHFTDGSVTAGYTYVYTLFAHAKDGEIGLPDKVSVAALSPGHYTVMVTVDPALVNKVGGWSRAKKKVAQQFAVINHAYNDPRNHLLLHYDFSVQSVTTFSGSCRAALNQPHPRSTFLLAEVDRCSKTVFGARTNAEWFNKQEAVLDAHHIGSLTAKPFANDEGEVLVHEFGHSRGCIDEYKVFVEKSKNPITQEEFTPPSSIMTDEYATHVFDPYSQDLINAEGDSLQLDRTEEVAAALLPRQIDVQVLEGGVPLTTSATVRLWPSEWGSHSVEPDASWTGVTNSQGLVQLPPAIFGQGPGSGYAPWDIPTPLFLATVIHQGEASAWLDVMDATVAAQEAPGAPYVLDLAIPAPPIQPMPTPTSTPSPL